MVNAGIPETDVGQTLIAVPTADACGFVEPAVELRRDARVEAAARGRDGEDVLGVGTAGLDASRGRNGNSRGRTSRHGLAPSRSRLRPPRAVATSDSSGAPGRLVISGRRTGSWDFSKTSYRWAPDQAAREPSPVTRESASGTACPASRPCVAGGAIAAARTTTTSTDSFTPRVTLGQHCSIAPRSPMLRAPRQERLCELKRPFLGLLRRDPDSKFPIVPST